MYRLTCSATTPQLEQAAPLFPDRSLAQINRIINTLKDTLKLFILPSTPGEDRSDTARNTSWYIHETGEQERLCRQFRQGARDKPGSETVFIPAKTLASAVTLGQYQLCEWFGFALLLRYPFHLETHHESCGHEGTVRTLQTSPCWASFPQPTWYA